MKTLIGKYFTDEKDAVDYARKQRKRVVIKKDMRGYTSKDFLVVSERQIKALGRLI